LAAGGRGCQQPECTEHERSERVATSEPGIDSTKSTLERELQKKEKALTEAATLLMLVKKRDLLWPQNEET
jgi:hypothetical protein